jgi:hypothetical protein
VVLIELLISSSSPDAEPTFMPIAVSPLLGVRCRDRREAPQQS